MEIAGLIVGILILIIVFFNIVSGIQTGIMIEKLSEQFELFSSNLGNLDFEIHINEADYQDEKFDLDTVKDDDCQDKEFEVNVN
jgi:hypothetical protein